MIWFAMLIPVLVSVVLITFFKRKVVWWEIFIPFVASVIFIGIAKLFVSGIGTTDTEYWGSMVREAQYYEKWDEYIHKTCSRQVSCGQDCTRTEYYDCSYVRRHPAEWVVFTSSNEVLYVREPYYRKLVRQFGMTPVFKDMHRDYHRTDGDMYWVRWNGDRNTAESIVTKHTYTNKVQASDDVFNFPPVDTSDVRMYGLYEYPQMGEWDSDYPSILGSNDLIAHEYLKYVNGMLGPKKQVRIWILLYKYPNQQAGMMQEAFWKGGNKNEFVVTIGIDESNNVKWVYPFSWTEVERLKIEVRNYISSQKQLDLYETIDYIGNEVEKQFVRKKFSDFDYLKVEPPMWAIVTVYFLTLLVNLIVAFIVVNNTVQEYHGYV